MMVIASAGVTRPAFAEASYPDKLQATIVQIIHDDASGRLRSAMSLYNGDRFVSGASLANVARKSGFSDQAAARIASVYAGGSPSRLPEAKWWNGEISVSDGGFTVTIGVDEYWHRSIRVNEKLFQWDWKVSAAANLRAYDALFEPKNKETSWMRFPSLIETAWADEVFRIKAAGLQIYFLVTATGEQGGQLYRLNDKVKEMVALCEAPEPADIRDDPFLKAIFEGTAAAQKAGSTILLKNCGSITEYAKKPVAVLRGVVGEPDGAPVYPRVPADLCGNLDRLAKCVRKIDPNGTESNAKKKKTPKDSEEWESEPSVKPDKKRGGQRAS